MCRCPQSVWGVAIPVFVWVARMWGGLVIIMTIALPAGPVNQPPAIRPMVMMIVQGGIVRPVNPMLPAQRPMIVRSPTKLARRCRLRKHIFLVMVRHVYVKMAMRIVTTRFQRMAANGISIRMITTAAPVGFSVQTTRSATITLTLSTQVVPYAKTTMGIVTVI